MEITEDGRNLPRRKKVEREEEFWQRFPAVEEKARVQEMCYKKGVWNALSLLAKITGIKSPRAFIKWVSFLDFINEIKDQAYYHDIGCDCGEYDCHCKPRKRTHRDKIMPALFLQLDLLEETVDEVPKLWGNDSQ